jgi:hypothetical protein
MKVFVLTSEYNEYDQHGEYFLAVFKNCPTSEQLAACGVAPAQIEHVLKGGGRQNVEDVWYHLVEEECQ